MYFGNGKTGKLALLPCATFAAAALFAMHPVAKHDSAEEGFREFDDVSVHAPVRVRREWLRTARVRRKERTRCSAADGSTRDRRGIEAGDRPHGTYGQEDVVVSPRKLCGDRGRVRGWRCDDHSARIDDAWRFDSHCHAQRRIWLLAGHSARHADADQVGSEFLFGAVSSLCPVATATGFNSPFSKD